MTNGRKKQVARLIKCECAECGYVARVARQWIDDKARRIARRTAK